MESKKIKTVQNTDSRMFVPWNPVFGIFLSIIIFFVSQIVAQAILVYPAIKHWSSSVTTNWINNSIYAQFAYVLIAEIIIVLTVLIVIKLYQARPNIIGLRRPKFSDPIFGLIAVPFYFIAYFFIVYAVSLVYSGLNVNAKQDIGFSSPKGAKELIITFVSLVILPPIAEEIFFRGFLYGSLKKLMYWFAQLGIKLKLYKVPKNNSKSSKFKRMLPQLLAAIITSAIFASAHLLEGTSGLLWIAAIDTFTLSLILVFLREKTDGLWAGMTLHGVKNFIAYASVFLLPLIKN